MPVVALLLRVKEGRKYPFYPASTARNGRIEPFVAIVNDRRKIFGSGRYYIRFTGSDGKQKKEGAWKDPAVAKRMQIAKQAELEAAQSGINVKVIDPTMKDGTFLADSIAEYVAFAQDTKRKKTWEAYANDLRYFADFCSKYGIETVDELGGMKELILKFPKYVMSKKGPNRKNPNTEGTAFNKFANAMIFLKWAGVETGIKKSEWPEKPERDPEEYSDEELTAMFSVADAEERLVLKSFLLTGFRSGELAHLTYERIEFDTSVWKVRQNDEWEWKPKKKASVRDVPVHPRLTGKINERKKARNAKQTDLVFPNEKDKPNKHLLRVVQRVAKRAGLTGIRVDDHKFRSTAITRWLEEGYTVPDVVRLAGHENMDTILRYAAKLTVRKKEHRAKADKVTSKFVMIGE